MKELDFVVVWESSGGWSELKCNCHSDSGPPHTEYQEHLLNNQIGCDMKDLDVQWWRRPAEVGPSLSVLVTERQDNLSNNQQGTEE